MTWILTNSGKHFDFADPQPDQIDILDIAQGLANECRYAGQCRVFYSVAQHSFLASQIVNPRLALEALLHDAAEAYCKDIPRPLKYMLPEYQAIEARVESAIRERFMAAGVEAVSSTPEELQKHIVAESRQVKRIIEVAGIRE